MQLWPFVSKNCVLCNVVQKSVFFTRFLGQKYIENKDIPLLCDSYVALGLKLAGDFWFGEKVVG